MNHVGLGKDGAAAGDLDGRSAFKRHRGEFFHREAQPPRLVLQKTAGARCADGVHGKIVHHFVAEDDEFGVLPTYLNDRFGIRDEVSGSQRLAGDLVFNDRRPEFFTDQLPGTAGDGDAKNLADDISFYLVERLFGCGQWVGGGGEVGGGQHRAVI